MKTQSVLLKLEPGFVERIDGVRGDVPRTVWIRRACEAGLAAAGSEPIAPQNPETRAMLEKVTRDVLAQPARKPVEAAPKFVSRLKGEWKAP